MIGFEGSQGLFENMRPSCSQCGGSIVWVKPHEMDSELVALAKEAAEWLGESAMSVWRCTLPACAEVGFFGGVHVELGDTGKARKRTRRRSRSK